MKMMIASDIHGSAVYCRKLLTAYREEGADKLLLLGDLLYHGPRNELPEEYRPKEVIELLNGIKEEILCVRGNCEAEADQMVLQFPVMAEYAILFCGKRMIFAAHGHHHNPQELPPLKEGDILLTGHTHVPVCDVQENYVYLNPGSTSIPKENSWHGYMIMDETQFLWKDFENNIKMRWDAK